MLAAPALIVSALFALAGPETPSWLEPYRTGVRLVEQGKGAEARKALETALRLRPAGGLRVPVGGVDYVDYLPHLYLAMACQMSGDPDAGRAYLVAAQQEGLAEKSEAGRPLLEAQRVLLRAESSKPATGSARTPAAPRYRDYERKPVVLSERETEDLRAEVLARCQLKPETRPQDAPWYFHYELGRNLYRRGDPQRALDALIEAATLRTEPGHGARIYGMWFMDYLPYLEIARAHARLGNWDCAQNALEFSRQAKEVSEHDKEFAEFRSLALETEGHLKNK
jgi:tetratricopeptide (TPR) repeat protein